MITPPKPEPTARLVPEMTMAVWPPAQSGSAQIKAALLSPVTGVPFTAARDAKLSALPPSVTPETDPAEPVPYDATQTIRQLPGVVDGMVTVRVLAPVVWTMEMATYNHLRRPVSRWGIYLKCST